MLFFITCKALVAEALKEIMPFSNSSIALATPPRFRIIVLFNVTSDYATFRAGPYDAAPPALRSTHSAFGLLMKLVQNSHPAERELSQSGLRMGEFVP